MFATAHVINNEITDDVLRDLFKRCKYPEVILAMCVFRLRDGLMKGAVGR